MTDPHTAEIAGLESQIAMLRGLVGQMADLPEAQQRLLGQLAQCERRLAELRAAPAPEPSAPPAPLGAVYQSGPSYGPLVGSSSGVIVNIIGEVLSRQRDPREAQSAIQAMLDSLPGRLLEVYQQIAAGMGRANVTLLVDPQGQLQLRAEALPDAPRPDDLRPFEELLRQLRQGLLQPDAAPPAEELAARAARYRALLVELFRDLRLAGLSASTRAIVLPLEEVYVQLRAVAEVPEAADAFSPEERRLLRLLEQRRGHTQRDDPELREAELRLDAIRRERWTRERPQRFPIAQALSDPHRRGLVILGDPGSGKSTLLHFLALLFAQGPEAVARHTPARGADAERLPIFAPLAAYDDMLRTRPDLTVQEFLALYYDRRRAAPGLGPVFDAAIAEGRALILLDGLDEVSNAERRRYVAEQAGSFVQAALARGSRVVLTSRIYGYRVAPLGGGLPHITVLDFRQEEIALFARQWYRAFQRWKAGGALSVQAELAAQEEERRLLDEIASNPGVERLAVNPLLLTMLALLREQIGSLPQRRITLYDEYVRALVLRWEDVRSRGARLHGAPRRVDLKEAEGALIELALWLQQKHPSGTATADDLLARLTIFYLWEDHGLRVGQDRIARPRQKEAEARAEAFLHDMREYSGLLIERGQNAFGFRHLTFQEYFAGRALARLPADERWALLHPHLHSGRWREPLLLCAARLGVAENRSAEASALVERILGAGSPYEALLRRDLLLAADCAADDIGLSLPLLQRIADALRALLDARVPALASAALQRLYRFWQLRAGGQARLPELERRLLERLFERAVPYGSRGSETGDMLRRMARDGSEEVRLFLHTQLTDTSWSMRAAAVQVLAGAATARPEIRTTLLSMLTDPHENVRVTVVRVLAKLATIEPEVRAILLSALADGHPDVRNTTVQALAELAVDQLEVRTALLSSLTDEDAAVRSSAVYALRRLAESEPEIRTVLINAITDPNTAVRRAAVNAVGELAAVEPIIHKTLLNILSDVNDPVRAAAIRALKKLVAVDPLVREAILNTLTDLDEIVRSAAIEALGELVVAEPLVQEALLNTLTDESPRSRASAIKALKEPAGSNPLIRNAIANMIYDPDNDVRRAYLDILAPFIDKDPHITIHFTKTQMNRDWETRLDILPYITDHLALYNCYQNKHCHEAYISQITVINTLCSHHLEHPKIELILHNAFDCPVWSVRVAAIEAINVVYPSQPSNRDIIRKHLTDADSDVRSTAVRALGQLIDLNNDICNDIHIALDDPDYKVRLLAAQILHIFEPSNPKIYTTLRNAINSTNHDARLRSINTIGQMDTYNPEFLNLINISLADTNNHIRRACIYALSKKSHINDDIKNTIRTFIEDPEPNVQSAAIDILSPTVSENSSLQNILRNKITSKHSNVRSAAIIALSILISSDTDISKAIYDAFSDKDAIVRVAAIQAASILVTTEPSIYNAIYNALTDAHWEVRVQTLRALGSLASSNISVSDALYKALVDPDFDVRATAIELLTPNIPNDPALYTHLLNAVGRNDVIATGIIGYEEQFKHMQRQLATAYGQIVHDDARRRAEVIAMLHEPDWRRRNAAAIILREAGPQAVREALPHLLEALEDTRGFDSWPARIAAAERLINDDHYSDEAIDLIQEALTYGADTIFPIDGADEVRQYAALALGKLKALHRRADLAAQIARLLGTEREPSVLDALYAALGSLAAAPELDL